MNKLFDFSDGVFVGKGIDALKNSRSQRNALIAMFGGVENLPSSVMRVRRPRPDKNVDKLVAESRGYNKTSRGHSKVHDSKLPKIVREAWTSSGKGCEAGALSTFPQAIGRSMVLLYTNPGDAVFDPFAGHNSRMDLCAKAGRHYIGCDISTEFMAFNVKRADKLRQLYPKAKIDLYRCDSKDIPVKEERADFSITSPPYYDIEYYGDEPGQLGKAKTYKDFLNGMQQVINETFRVLKPGAFSVWFVNDFRRKGVFHLYHVDIIRLAKRAGFTVHDLLIVDLGNSIRDCFTNQIITTRIIPKRHEYGLVFRRRKHEES